MLIALEEYEQSLHGFSITDCVVRDRSRFTFVAERFLSEAEVAEEERNEGSCAPSYYCVSRVLPFMRDDPPGDQWGCTTLEGWTHLFQGAAALAPLNQFVGLDLLGHVFVTGSGIAEQEDDIPSIRDGGPIRGEIRKVKTIGGYPYVCGGERSVGKRLDKNRWFSHTQAMPAHPEAPSAPGYPPPSWCVTSAGFDDIDGFAEDDLYAVGGKADVWHWDGHRWEQVTIPTDKRIDAVCCAGDGEVYIASSLEGHLIAGRGDRWRVLSTKEVHLGFRDLVWHEDRVWCANDHGLWTVHEGRLARAELPGEIAACAGHLYVNDGVLLAAGLGGAAFKERGEWHSIVARPEMEKRLREAKRHS